MFFKGGDKLWKDSEKERKARKEESNLSPRGIYII